MMEVERRNERRVPGRENRDETIVVPSDEDLIDEIRQGSTFSGRTGLDSVRLRGLEEDFCFVELDMLALKF